MSSRVLRGGSYPGNPEASQWSSVGFLGWYGLRVEILPLILLEGSKGFRHAVQGTHRSLGGLRYRCP